MARADLIAVFEFLELSRSHALPSSFDCLDNTQHVFLVCFPDSKPVYMLQNEYNVRRKLVPRSHVMIFSIHYHISQLFNSQGGLIWPYERHFPSSEESGVSHRQEENVLPLTVKEQKGNHRGIRAKSVGRSVGVAASCLIFPPIPTRFRTTSYRRGFQDRPSSPFPRWVRSLVTSSAPFSLSHTLPSL